MKKGNKVVNEKKEDEDATIDEVISSITLHIVSLKKSIPGSGMVIFWPKESEASEPPSMIDVNDDDNHELFELFKVVKQKNDDDKKAKSVDRFRKILDYAHKVSGNALFGGQPNSIVLSEELRSRADEEATKSYVYNKDKCSLSFETSAIRGIETYASVIGGSRKDVTGTDKLALELIVSLSTAVINGLM
jgi:hypothetical protein